MKRTGILSTPWLGVETDPWHGGVEKDPWHAVEKDPWHGVESDSASAGQDNHSARPTA